MTHLTTLFGDALTQAYQAVFGDQPDDLQTTISYPEPKFGHLASSLAMKVAKELKTPPMEISKQLCSQLQKNSNFASVAVVAPGFINVRFTDAILLHQLTDICTSPEAFQCLFRSSVSTKKMVMDYSHPNIGKPMGVHHLLSTVLGDTIKRMYRGLGIEVIADNFVGDLGTQFGKLILAVKTWGDLKTIEQDPISELLKLYVRFHIDAESDDTLDDAARAEFQKLEAGDPENRALWQKIVRWSRAEIQPIYDQLGVSFDVVHGESFYEDKMEPIIARGIEQGLFVKSDGALVYKLKNPDLPPAIIRKKDGATLYLTRDLARIDYWEKTWHPDLMIVVVDMAQSLHFVQVFEVATALGLTTARNVHVAFGRMQFADKSMSTRKGNILLLHDLLAEAKKRALALAVEKSGGLTESENQDLANILAIDSIKYSILSQNRLSNIIFDWGKILSFDGNSAPYLVYTAVRARSVLNKATGLADTVSSGQSIGPSEQALICLLSRYPLVLAQAVSEFKPNDLASYLYSLCQSFNTFYNSNEILRGGDAKAIRLQLTQAMVQVLELGLGLLGLQIPAKM